MNTVLDNIKIVCKHLINQSKKRFTAKSSHLAAFVAPLTSGHVLRSFDSESGVSKNRGVSEAFTSQMGVVCGITCTLLIYTLYTII